MSRCQLLPDTALDYLNEVILIIVNIVLKLFLSCQYYVHCVNILSICQCQLFARMLFWEGLEVCRWILLFTRMFLGVSGCLDVDIMWMLLFARMFLEGVWMSGC